MILNKDSLDILVLGVSPGSHTHWEFKSQIFPVILMYSVFRGDQGICNIYFLKFYFVLHFFFSYRCFFHPSLCNSNAPDFEKHCQVVGWEGGGDGFQTLQWFQCYLHTGLTYSSIKKHQFPRGLSSRPTKEEFLEVDLDSGINKTKDQKQTNKQKVPG